MNDEMESIRCVVAQYREAIEESYFDELTLKDFPERCCHHASDLLLLHFSELGISGFEKFEGTVPGLEERYNKHNWLQRGDLIIDITADQFEGENLPPVIVTKKSEFHQRLNGKSTGVVTLDRLQRKREFYEKHRVIQRIEATLDRLEN